MLDLGTPAPAFKLSDAEGKSFSLDDVAGAKGLFVAFICNHCPYVKLIASELARFADDYREKGIGTVAISSNDYEKYPDDRPELMLVEARNRGYRFPYLVDEDQSVARAYRAACTPDFYLFDGQRRLVYRGQFDDARPGASRPVTGQDMRAAADALILGNPIPSAQRPSIGCNIKWKPGNEPDYFVPKKR